MPSMEAILTTFAGLSCEAAAFSGPCRAWVRKNGDLRLRLRTLSHPLSGNSSNSAPQAAPALLTKISSLGSSAVSRSASALHPSTVERSWGRDTHGPCSESACAVSLHWAVLRDEM